MKRALNFLGGKFVLCHAVTYTVNTVAVVDLWYLKPLNANASD